MSATLGSVSLHNTCSLSWLLWEEESPWETGSLISATWTATFTNHFCQFSAASSTCGRRKSRDASCLLTTLLAIRSAVRLCLILRTVVRCNLAAISEIKNHGVSSRMWLGHHKFQRITMNTFPNLIHMKQKHEPSHMRPVNRDGIKKGELVDHVYKTITVWVNNKGTCCRKESSHDCPQFTCEGRNSKVEHFASIKNTIIMVNCRISPGSVPEEIWMFTRPICPNFSTAKGLVRRPTVHFEKTWVTNFQSVQGLAVIHFRNT